MFPGTLPDAVKIVASELDATDWAISSGTNWWSARRTFASHPTERPYPTFRQEIYFSLGKDGSVRLFLRDDKQRRPGETTLEIVRGWLS